MINNSEYVECDLLIDPDQEIRTFKEVLPDIDTSLTPEQKQFAQDGMWEALEREQGKDHLPCSSAEEDWNAVIERRNREYDDLHPIRIVKR